MDWGYWNQSEPSALQKLHLLPRCLKICVEVHKSNHWFPQHQNTDFHNHFGESFMLRQLRSSLFISHPPMASREQNASISCISFIRDKKISTGQPLLYVIIHGNYKKGFPVWNIKIPSTKHTKSPFLPDRTSQKTFEIRLVVPHHLRWTPADPQTSSLDSAIPCDYATTAKSFFATYTHTPSV